jgi:hypothetical protein
LKVVLIYGIIGRFLRFVALMRPIPGFDSVKTWSFHSEQACPERWVALSGLERQQPADERTVIVFIDLWEV